jgi:hypothetical protein
MCSNFYVGHRDVGIIGEPIWILELYSNRIWSYARPLLEQRGKSGSCMFDFNGEALYANSLDAG